MNLECKLKPGMNSAEFIIKFNEMNFDVMAGLDLDHDTGLYGMVFFERSEIIELSFMDRIKRKIYSWLNI